MESDVQPSPVAVPQDVIAIAAEAAATSAAAAAGAPPALIGSIVRSVVSHRHRSMAWTCSVAGASQEAGSGMGMQQRVPQYVGDSSLSRISLHSFICDARFRSAADSSRSEEEEMADEDEAQEADGGKI